MAPNGHQAPAKKGIHKSSDSSSVFWEDKHGHREFMDWKEANQNGPFPSYEEWVESQKKSGGLSLYYTALRMFEDSDSTDEEAPPVKAKPQVAKARGQVGRPKKTASTNGNGLSRTAESAKSTAVANSEDFSPSGKKRRKARKKPLSEEVVASASDSEVVKDVGASAPVAETATPTAPMITFNGQRKSSTRKARKKPISEETISPDDELEDPMETTIDEVSASAIASPLPVRSAPKSPAPVPTSDSPKKSHILKLSTRKTPKKKNFPEGSTTEGGAVVEEDPTQATPSDTVSVAEAGIIVNTNVTPKVNGKIAQDTDSTAASPDPTTASAGSTRRGLRTRKPAQQRPYYHDSQLFEDVEPTNGDAQDSSNMSPAAQGRRVSVASISKNIDDALLASLDEEAMALLQEETEPESAKPKHFKGKGRAWKKEGSDEDEEFSIAASMKAASKKAAKAARMKAKGQIPKKRGRPRKSGRSEELIDEETDEDKDAVKRKRPPPRKSALSEEVIIDSSDEEEAKEMEVEESTTPKHTPNKSYTPQGLPKYISEVDNGANGDPELGTGNELEVASPSKETV
ncbi:unnamed protein product [Alternaria alternata]|uniref:Uncharacterized protein n=1 Tax=Alternaria tenuissima TaxID=119927 RepID=A0A4V1WL95_9PLEO|nr:uncharacterized protein J4E82_002855 [Alternaria postmessia]RYN26763.1 hypothetical protein AA0115_g6890 [Alternaria tenuissima]KAI5378539.1 hypothetical protein J4E82_002855 [Alternaria postmessia]RYN36982.1 hypothetical protein AA0114_g11601 [Alternaria tenuissima]RYN69877.1 hypothetical protein AA0118_g98 [Alternaria tenuissima]RYO56323.1 hypothetical protein AA0116_g9129 [Alternaria tenuissima]